MKKLLIVCALSFISVNCFAHFTEGQRQCWEVTNQLSAKYAQAAVEVLAALKSQGRVSDNDFTEYDAATLPARKTLEVVSSLCREPSLTVEQVKVLKKTFL